MTTLIWFRAVTLITELFVKAGGLTYIQLNLRLACFDYNLTEVTIDLRFWLQVNEASLSQRHLVMAGAVAEQRVIG